MGKLYNQYFSYKDNFVLNEKVSSIPIFESRLDFAPKFTIAIPTYKRPELLKEAVDSALNQFDFEDYDVIIVDNDPKRDCETEKLMNSYTNIRLSYFKNSENLGMCGNWNRLYTLGKGEWVIMLHDDDLLLPNYLSVMNFLIEKSIGYSAIFPSYTYFKGKNINISDYVLNTSKNNYNCWRLVENDFLYDNVIGAPLGMCFKKNDFIKLGGFSYDFYPSNDYDFYIKACHRFKIGKIVDEDPLCLYRFEENLSKVSDVILLCIKIDFGIKMAIIDKYLYIIKYLWKLFFIEFSYYYLNRACVALDIKDIDVNKELHFLGYKKNFRTKFVYKVIKKIKKFFFKRTENFFIIN